MDSMEPASNPPGPRYGAAARVGDAIVGTPERAVYALFGYFLPDTSVIRGLKFQHLLTAKFLADAARDSVRYAAIVGVIYNGGGAFASSLIGIAALIPGVVFSLYGGAISDSLPKRSALFLAYGVDVALCIALPLFFRESNLMLFVLVFAITSLTQIASPAEQTLVPLVTSEEQLATANSIMGMVSSIGTAVGTAFMAPILLKAFGTNAVFYAAAVLLLAAMTRVVHIDAPKDIGRPKFIRPRASFRGALRWLVRNPSIGTMVAVSAVAGMGYTIISTLAPTYVSDVLETDPANTVYVMGVAGIGMTLSLLAVPTLIKLKGERVVAAAGFFLLAGGLVALGLVNRGVVDFLTPINPFHWLNELIDRVNINEKTELAMLLSFPVGMGAGLTDNSVKTYLNRRVPVAYQGRTFATRNLTESALTIPPLLAVSALAVWLGISAVLFIMPVVFYIVVMALLRVSVGLGGEELAPGTGVAKTYWDAPETEEISDMDEEDDRDVEQAPPAT